MSKKQVAKAALIRARIDYRSYKTMRAEIESWITGADAALPFRKACALIGAPRKWILS